MMNDCRAPGLILAGEITRQLRALMYFGGRIMADAPCLILAGEITRQLRTDEFWRVNHGRAWSTSSMMDLSF